MLNEKKNTSKHHTATFTQDEDIQYNRVTVIKSGNIVDVRETSVRGSKGVIKSLPDGMYLNKKTGEIKEKKHKAESRTDNIRYIRESFHEMRNYINANCTTRNTKWITLTYRQDYKGSADGFMTDHRKAVEDFKRFFNRKVRKMFPAAEYIYAIEPQANGAWHIHFLLICDNIRNVFLDNEEVIEKWWGHGFTMTKNIKELNHGKGVDNIGAYLTSYLTDLKPDEIDEEMDGETAHSKHMIEKGKRLALYPAHCRLWSHSKGLKKPETHVYDNMLEALADNGLVGVKPCYEQHDKIEVNADLTIYYHISQYNLERADKEIYRKLLERDIA